MTYIYGIQPGDTFRLVNLDGILVLTPMAPEPARAIERICLETGLTTEELLAGLREQRARYVAQTYQVAPGQLVGRRVERVQRDG